MNMMSSPTMWGRKSCSDLCFSHMRQCYTCGWTDGSRCGEFLSEDGLEKTENGQLSEGLVVHVNQFPDGEKVRRAQYLQLPISHRTQKDWTTEFYRHLRRVALKLKPLCCCVTEIQK